MLLEARRVVLTAREVNILTQPCCYKVLSSENEYLYIGSSKYGITRFLNSGHLQNEVIRSAGRIEAEFFDTKDEALAAEREAIKSLDPENNENWRSEQSLIGTETICAQCEKPFKMKREWQRFCSDSCRNQHWINGHPKPE
jgi:hypothetical protein